MTTSRDRLAQAFDALAEAAARVSIELSAESADDLPPMDSTVTVTAGSYEDDTASSSVAVCPAHGKPYVEGQYGPYCTSLSDDPEWSNRRGYCRITPKNASAYTRQAVAAGKR